MKALYMHLSLPWKRGLYVYRVYIHIVVFIRLGAISHLIRIIYI